MMNEKYLIEQHVRRIYNNIPELPEKDYKWQATFLGELLEEEFYCGYCSFNTLIKNVLNDVRNNPESWGMRCYNTQYFYCNAPRSPQEAQTDKDLSRIGETFFTIGKFGNIINNSLHIKNDILKAQKISKVKIIINKLQDFGFVINNNETEFIIEYPDNHSILQIIKAYSMLKIDNKDPNRNLILKAEWIYFGKGWVNRIPVDDYCKSLDKDQAENVKSIYELFVKYGYEVDIESLCFEANHKKDKQRLAGTKKERDDLSCWFRLYHFSEYIDAVDAAPDHIKNMLFEEFYPDYVCCGKQIKRCVGPFTYMRDGITYSKCRMASCGIGFVNMSERDREIALKLLECEIKARFKTLK